MNARGRKRKRRQAHKPEEVNRLRAIEDAAEMNRENDLRWVMSDPRGRRVMAALVDPGNDAAGYPVDTAGRGDPLVAAFDHGMRQAAAELNEELRETTPDEWTLMQAEATRPLMLVKEAEER